MSDPSVEQELYRKTDQAKVKKMRDNREQQRQLWSYVNYPKALWIHRGVILGFCGE